MPTGYTADIQNDISFEDGNTVRGYMTADDVLAFMNKIATMAPAAAVE